MSVVGTKRTCWAVLMTSVDGVDRKWLTDGQNGAIDPQPTSRNAKILAADAGPLL